MKWTVTTPPASRLLTLPQVQAHLRLDGVATAEERDYLLELIDAATDGIGLALNTSLMTQTITATFFAGDELYLPRGPVNAISSMTDGDGLTVASTKYRLEAYGNADLINLLAAVKTPLAVVYTAGYADAASVPAMIRQVIKCIIGLMYEQRQMDVAEALHEVPSLESFLRLYSRNPGVG